MKAFQQFKGGKMGTVNENEEIDFDPFGENVVIVN